MSPNTAAVKKPLAERKADAVREVAAKITSLELRVPPNREEMLRTQRGPTAW